MGEQEQEAAGAPRHSGTPASGLESAIASIWCDILDVDQVEVGEDFFELGGDSLGAVRMLAAIADVLASEVAFTDFLEGPTIAALASVVRSSRRQPAVDREPAAPPEEDGRAPASFAQDRLWFVQQLEGSTDAYNMPIGARLRGVLDTDALERSLHEVIDRHAALRTTFASVDGHALQVVASGAAIELERFDVCGAPDPEAEAQRIVDELTSAALELERGPLMRAALIRVAEQEHILELVFHHIICDGWSQMVVFRELGILYAAYARGALADLPAPRIQYPEFARRQRAELQGSALQDAVAPWLERLAGAPAALDLPTDRPRPPAPSYRGETYRVPLPAQVTAGVRRFAREARATPFATLLAVYYLLLHRRSGQGDIVVGATTSGRESADLQDGVGLFANTVALRVDLTDELSFRELVERVRDTVLWAIAHESAPFEQIVAQLPVERDLSRHPVFQVFCAYVPQVSLGALEAQPYDARPATSRFDLTLFVEEEPGGQLELAWEYSRDLFDAATIEGYGREYEWLLSSGLANPDGRIGDLRPLTEVLRPESEPAAGSDRVAYPVACMHELFAQRAAQAPDAVALSYESGSLSYGELNQRANRLAHHLRELGAGPETLVALFLEPSHELMIAVLAVLKAGAAYVPIDPAYPSDRVGFVLGDAAAPLLITVDALRDRLPAHDATVVCLDGGAALLEAHSADDPVPLAGPENLAYVIYTSGSTGRPKGVQVEHRQVARLFSATDEWYGFGPSDTWVLLHSYAFDFSVWEMWGALAYGGHLVISPLWTTRSPESLARLVARERVTVLNVTPSLFAAVQDELVRVGDELALRFVIFGGEALAPATLRPWFERFGDADPTLVNMYGITETTVHVTYRPLTIADSEQERSPIGIPIPDLSLYLLDPGGAPVAPGVAGELFVGGAGVARGYLNRPELTAERFLVNPFGSGRLYRTGDVARRLPDGELEFRGRIDDQVKIRGYRIELGEIRAAIRELPGVADSAVVAVEAAPGDTRLAAYVVPEAGSDGAAPEELADRLRSHLDDKLPAFMIPASLTLLEALPLTRNGKTDLKALPVPRWDKESDDGFSVPSTPTETLIAEIWQAVLGVERVGSHDNFFNLGGHSLLAARVVMQVRERCQAELTVRALFEQPVLSSFAEHVDAARAGSPAAQTTMGSSALAHAQTGNDSRSSIPAVSAAPPPRVSATGATYPLSFPQQQMLFLQELVPGSYAYNAGIAITVHGQLDRALLSHALSELFNRHEALRTVLVWDENSQHQVVIDDPSVGLEFLDLSALGPDERAEDLERLLLERSRRPFDLAKDFTLRTTLFRLGPAEHVLLFGVHHVGWDAWAVDVLYQDLGELYAAALEGRPPQLRDLPKQYGDFAVYQRERLRGERLEAELDFWRHQLAGAPTLLRLPTDRPRPATQTFAGASRTVMLAAELAQRLQQVCQAQTVTPYMFLLAVFATLLYRRSDQDDILFGGPMANRDHPGFEHLIGFFANTIIVRARLGGNPRFSELLERVRESVLESYEHQEVPLEVVLDAVRPQRQAGANPLFQVNFRVRVGAAPELRLGDAVTSIAPVDLGLARFDLALELHVRDDGIAAEFNYATDLFDPATIDRLARDYENLLREALSEPQTRLLSFRLAAGQNGGPDDTAHVAHPAGTIRRFRQSRRPESA